jgi:hypothetical protein
VTRSRRYAWVRPRRMICLAAPRALIGRCLPQLGSPPQRTTLGSRDASPHALQGIGARRVGKVAKVVYAYRGPKMMDSTSRRLGPHTFAMGAFDRQQFPRRETPSHRVRERGTEASWRTGCDAVEQFSRALMPKRQSRCGLERRDGERSKSRRTERTTSGSP